MVVTVFRGHAVARARGVCCTAQLPITASLQPRCQLRYSSHAGPFNWPDATVDANAYV